MARLYEIQNGKVVPFWLRNGLFAGVGLPVPTSEHFRVYGVRMIGRGRLATCQENGRTLAVLFPECDRDGCALVMITGAIAEILGGQIVIQDSAAKIVEILPGGSIKTGRFELFWDGRDMVKI